MKKIAFYSHDTFGLGHVRRVTKLANHLALSRPDLHCLIVSGSDRIGQIPLSPRVDFVRMPGVTKTGPGRYRARRLGVSIQRLTSIRAALLQSVVHSFRPHIFVVDNVPLGMRGEVSEVLEGLAASARPVSTVLTMRDVLDSPSVIRKVWKKRGDYEALSRLYDRILVFGDARIFNPVEAYALPPQVAAKVRFCGFIGAAEVNGNGDGDLDLAKAASQQASFVTVTAGGGEDGYPLIRCYLEGAASRNWDGDRRHLILLGPYMPRTRKRALQARYGGLEHVYLKDFVRNPGYWLRQSDLVVSMGGYNTVYELLSLGVRGLIVPRIYPRKEQLIRARTLAKRGLLEMLHPDKLTPRSLERCVGRCLDGKTAKGEGRKLGFGGLERAEEEIQKLLDTNPSTGKRER